MKVKRYTTDGKSRNLRNAGEGRNDAGWSRSPNMSEQAFCRRKRKSGTAMMPRAQRLKELKKRNRELKGMLTGSLLKRRILRIVNAKKH